MGVRQTSTAALARPRLHQTSAATLARPIQHCRCTHVSWCATNDVVPEGDLAGGVCGQRADARENGDQPRALTGKAGGGQAASEKGAAAGGNRPEGDVS